MSSVTSLDSQVYYKETYWDAYPQAKRYIQKQTSGYTTKNSLAHFKENYAKKPFVHGLFLNCGNGWLERWCIEHKIVRKATGFDCSAELIAEANRKKKKLPITYFIADANTIELPEDEYDLVVNSAALHHVQYLNRFCYQVARTLKPNGAFFHFDYIGPHRNQYPRESWSLIKQVNKQLPESVRKDPLLYAHIPSMIATDPSEAIHSELIFQMVERYFHTIERHDISGMIAYNLLSLNKKLKRGEQNRHIQHVIDEDKKAFAESKIPPLFTYMVTKPNKDVLKDIQKISWWQTLENIREKDAKWLEYTYSCYEFFPLLIRRPIQRSLRMVAYLFSKIFSYFYLVFAFIYSFLIIAEN